MAEEPSKRAQKAAAPQPDVKKSTEEVPNEKKGTRRAIPGNLPYLSTPKRLGDALKGLIAAERPQKFNEDFLGTVLGIRGGSARPIPPIFKRVGLLNSDNSPTELYSKFKSDTSRPVAALQALRNGFAEIFKRNEYAHKENDDRLRDLVVEVTGLAKNDPIVNLVAGTFNVFREYAKGAPDGVREAASNSVAIEDKGDAGTNERARHDQSKFTLVNTINVVLPETTDVQVYNAIFRSIRDNLMQ